MELDRSPEGNSRIIIRIQSARLLFTALFILVLFLLLLTLLPPHSQGLLTIDEDTIYADETVTFNESIMITSNSTLTFLNCTILFDSTEAEDLNVSIDNDCRLEIINSTFNRKTNEDRYYFFVEGELDVAFSKLHNIGGLDNEPKNQVYDQNFSIGIQLIPASKAILHDVSFPNSSTYLIQSNMSSIRLDHVSFQAKIMGLYCRNSDITITNSSVSSELYIRSTSDGDFISTSMGLFLSKCNVSIIDSEFRKEHSSTTFNSRGVYLANSSCTISNSSFYNHTYGIKTSSNSELYVENCSFDGTFISIFYDHSFGETVDTVFTNTTTSIYFYQFYPTYRNLTFIPDDSNGNGFLPMEENSFQFLVDTEIQVYVNINGNASQFHSFGEGIEIMEADGNIVETYTGRSYREWNSFFITNQKFKKLNSDIISTPIMLRAYWEHNESYVNTTLGELMNGEPFNISIAYFPEKLPDLTIINFSISETLVVEGDHVMIRAIVKNIGDLVAHSIEVKFVWKSQTIFVQNIALLNPGEYILVEYLWQADYHGYNSQRIECYVDLDNEIKEHDDRNNFQSVSVDIEFAPSSGTLRDPEDGVWIFAICVLAVVGFFWWNPWKNMKKGDES